jgi:hypothetical protein
MCPYASAWFLTEKLELRLKLEENGFNCCSTDLIDARRLQLLVRGVQLLVDASTPWGGGGGGYRVKLVIALA